MTDEENQRVVYVTLASMLTPEDFAALAANQHYISDIAAFARRRIKGKKGLGKNSQPNLIDLIQEAGFAPRNVGVGISHCNFPMQSNEIIDSTGIKPVAMNGKKFSVKEILEILTSEGSNDRTVRLAAGLVYLKENLKAIKKDGGKIYFLGSIQELSNGKWRLPVVFLDAEPSILVEEIDPETMRFNQNDMVLVKSTL
jgi:hypothetical protein